MGERITLTASDGFTLNAYRAAPEGQPRGGVVVIQEVWGLNTWIRSVVDRFARHGYLAVAPAMFDRVEFGYESDSYTPEQFEIIGGLLKKFDHQTALLDVAAAIEAAKAGGKVGITGYCFGGAVSWRAAHHGMGLSAASGDDGGGGAGKGARLGRSPPPELLRRGRAAAPLADRDRRASTDQLSFGRAVAGIGVWRGRGRNRRTRGALPPLCAGDGFRSSQLEQRALRQISGPPSDPL